MHPCRVCQRNGIHRWLDFGRQPIRHRFLGTAAEEEFSHPLKLGACWFCGAVQLASPPPVEELRPRFDWLRYTEPEHHLDDVVTHLRSLPGVAPESLIAGVSYLDDSTLERFRSLGFASVWRPDPRADLGIENRCAGMESIQERLTPTLAQAMMTKRRQPDLLVLRYVLEHAHDPRSVLQWARTLLRPGGYLMIEVPDAHRALEQFDYTTVWEEHVLYFTTSTLSLCLELAGFEVVSLRSYAESHQHSLVAVARTGPAAGRSSANPNTNALIFAERFLHEFERVKGRVRQQLAGQGRIAMLGAGHVTGAFINLYELADCIEFVVDDNPRKQGLFMPGSRLPILPASELAARGVNLCLMAVRPEAEAAVIARNEAFQAQGGVLASIFPESPHSLERLGRATVSA
jgi:hypothetical protein